MVKSRLTQRRVDVLKPDEKTLDVRDCVIRGFGVRVLSSGRKCYFLHRQVDGKRAWHSIGDAREMTLDCARERATSLLVSRSRPDEDFPATTASILFEDVADEVFRRYRRHWKPRTLAVNLGYLRNQILPWFRGRAIGDITRRDVRRWFGSLRATPVAADRSAPVLSVILRQAEVYGYRPEGSNPCTGIKRYRRRNRERFLNDDEIRRLSRVLDGRHAKQHQLVSIVRMLLLTGCRKSEILTLKWPDYREGKLYLPDSKTGPRTVWLSSPVRRILDGLPRRGPWVFPSPQGGNRHLSDDTFYRFWSDVRTEAGITDVRCHDLRHTYASVAMAHGETVLTIGRLLGHNDPATTLKYTHLADASVHEAAEALVPVLGGRTGP
ncbi:MAG: tyrosine-type recombinase/integrase [Alphaproteobacteria bacterium]|nr:tyrosine-type recombinase/integrase [Alphaproteobacteria bacterium]